MRLIRAPPHSSRIGWVQEAHHDWRTQEKQKAGGATEKEGEEGGVHSRDVKWTRGTDERRGDKCVARNAL